MWNQFQKKIICWAHTSFALIIFYYGLGTFIWSYKRGQSVIISFEIFENHTQPALWVRILAWKFKKKFLWFFCTKIHVNFPKITWQAICDYFEKIHDVFFCKFTWFFPKNKEDHTKKREEKKLPQLWFDPMPSWLNSDYTLYYAKAFFWWLTS